jgi:tRNA(Ile)-lysidine synthase
MVLLHLLHTWRRRLQVELAVVHLHHHLRGREADADAALVKQFCAQWNLPFHLLEADIAAIAREEGWSLEEAGHQVREKLFTELAGREGYHVIATGHHRDDQAETVLERLIQGTGLRGLAGIRLRRGRWVRPLLFAHRSEIEQYARSYGIPFRQDASNQDLRFRRNKIRHHLLPLLQKEYNPAAAGHLAELAETLQEWDDYLSEEVKKAWKQCVLSAGENEIALDIKTYSGYFSWIKIALLEDVFRRGFSRESIIRRKQWDSFEWWVKQGHEVSQFRWDDRVWVQRRGATLVFYSPHRLLHQPTELAIFPGIPYHLPDSNIQLTISEVGREAVRFTGERNVEFICGDRLHFPLTLRRWQPGDRFVPLGASYSVLVSDYLTDRGIRQPQKSQVMVLLNGNEIVAIPGIQMDERYKISEQCKKIFRLTISNGYQA